MERLELLGWRIQFDREATQAAHAAMSAGGAEECGCNYCRNWLETHTVLMPPALLDLLDNLGIPSNRDTEVYHCGRVGPGRHSYGGWYHFVGLIEFGEKESSPQLEYERFKVYFRSHSDLLSRVFAGLPVVQLQFDAEVPWLSNLPEPD